MTNRVYFRHPILVCPELILLSSPDRRTLSYESDGRDWTTGQGGKNRRYATLHPAASSAGHKSRPLSRQG